MVETFNKLLKSFACINRPFNATRTIAARTHSGSVLNNGPTTSSTKSTTKHDKKLATYKEKLFIFLLFIYYSEH